jgi:hypothetical protein
MTPIEERLATHREWILNGEFCSLFHDLGKLSKKFIEYRQTWYSSEHGWSEDPHEHDFLNNDQIVSKYRMTNDALINSRSFQVPDERINIADVMNNHANKLGNLHTKYERALKVGDSLDSAHQRNNPLFSGEQTPRSRNRDEDLAYPVFKSDVFGYESDETILTPSNLDVKREELYKELEIHPEWRSWWTGVTDAESRVACLKAIQEAFEPGLGDTTRPVNDTSLWEHTYSVASLTKAIQTAYAIYGNTAFTTEDQWNNPPLMMWGIGWDTIRFIGRGQRIHDLSARREVMSKAREKVKRFIEFQWAIGNTVYEDDGAMVFIVPGREASKNDDAHLKSAAEEYAQFLQERREDIVRLFAEATDCELCPRFADQPAYRDDAPDLTMVVKLLAEIRVPGSAFVPSTFFEKVSKHSAKSTDSENVCPICRIRQIKVSEETKKSKETGKSDKVWKKETACGICLDRRGKTARKQRDKGNTQAFPETPFMSEISDGNGRIAMVVARFGLDKWLNGEMVRTTFVTEADGLERELQLLGKTKDTDFEANEKNALDEIKRVYDGQDWSKYDFQRIQGEVEAARCNNEDKFVNPELAKATYFLYGRRDSFNPKIKWAWPDKKTVNQIVAKTPTASRLLNAWRTTERFFTDWALKANSDGLRRIHGVVLPRERMVYSVDSLLDSCHEFQTYTGTINEKPIEFTVDPSDRTVSIIRGMIDAAGFITNIKTSEGTLIEGEIRVNSERRPPEPFSPFRVVLATPELFMLLVPADSALLVIEALYKEFEERFGKVIGRLPFSIGSIFFQEKQPMFIVLDAARRMLNNFASRHGKVRGEWTVNKDSDKSGSINFENGYSWNLFTKPGQQKIDFYHPYVLVDNCDATRKSYQETPMGKVVHISDVKKGDIVHPPASDFDFEFLDSSAARFRISIGAKEKKRADHVLNDSLTRPIPIEALSAEMVETWKLLKSQKLMNSSLRDMLTLLITKLEEWHIQLPLQDVGKSGEPAFEWTQLVHQQIVHRLPKLDNKERKVIHAQITSGVFFETAFLYLHILKQGLENGD